MGSRATNKGFTIIELMIAVAVFATTMAIVLAGVIFISRQYQQASNRVALEEASRDIHQQITQSIQFSGKALTDSDNNGIADEKTPTGSDYSAVCIGNYMYIYGSTEPVVPDGSGNFSYTEGLYIKNNLNNCAESDVNLSADANGVKPVNLLPPYSFVSKFKVTTTGSVSTVFVRLPEDADDMLSLAPAGPNAGDAQCNITIAGREFCATVKLESSATRRVGN